LTASLHIDDLRNKEQKFGFVEHDVGHGKFRMFLGGNDDGIALRLYWNKSYEPKALKTWSALAKRCELALDIGAHTGIYTLAARVSNPGLSVAAFEASPANFYRMNLNLRANGLSTGNTFQKAVWSKTEIVRFSVHPDRDYLSSGNLVGAAKDATIISVEGVALDEFMLPELWARVGMLKIDIEGREGEAIKGMMKMLQAAKPIMFFECINAASGAAMEAALRPMGYRFCEVDDDAGTITLVDAITPYFDAQACQFMAKQIGSA